MIDLNLKRFRQLEGPLSQLSSAAQSLKQLSAKRLSLKRLSVKRSLHQLSVAKRTWERRHLTHVDKDGRRLAPRFTKVIGWERNKIKVGRKLKMSRENELNFLHGARKNRVVIGNRVNLTGCKINISGVGNRLVFEDDVRFRGRIMIVGTNRCVRIGARTTVQGAIVLARDADVTIGKDCMLSREIEIRATDVHKLRTLETHERVNPAAPVVIGDRVWICARAFVSKGTRVGAGSVIGAASFVQSAFDEENVVVAGVPARIVRRGVEWER